MQRSKTHFEQIPVAVVKKIAEEVQDDGTDESDSAIKSTPPGKLKPLRMPSLGNNKKRV